jgi:Fe-S oxidoreductase
LLHAFGYNVEIPEHEESGRTFLSKGLLRKAKKIANNNIRLLKDKITEATPLIGIEPSAILTFRDEYIDLAEPELREDAIRIAKNALMFDEFISSIQHPALRQAQGPASSPSTSSGPGIQDPALRQAQDPESSIRFKELFIKSKRTILLHGHCHQKALASVASTVKMLSIPENYKVEEIKSGCCGMAGSFGYEREHYDVSMKVGELVLFPKVREAAGDVIIAAPGTSCRHQIFDGTGRSAFHPIEILFEALVKS